MKIICWFKSIQNIRNYSFIQFDINSHCSGIFPILLNKSLIFAKQPSHITWDKIDILLARKPIIEFEGELWTRSDTTYNFDIAIGTDDSTEILI